MRLRVHRSVFACALGVLACAAVAAAGCRRGVGGECTASSDCQSGLICDPLTGTCVKPGGGTDAAPGTDATGPGTDATGPGTDATGPGTDAIGPGTDAIGPGNDAAGPGTDASGPSGTDAISTGSCSSPPAPGDPVSCYQTCSTSADCTWVDSDCCCNCYNGGPSVAINSAYTSEWAAHMAATCATVDCTMIGCLTVVVCPSGGPTCGAGGLCM